MHSLSLSGGLPPGLSTWLAPLLGSVQYSHWVHMFRVTTQPEGREPVVGWDEGIHCASINSTEQQELDIDECWPMSAVLIGYRIGCS